MIKYSIIVPAYNAADWLPRCLAALQDQSIERADYEIIVVDDGSTDQTAATAERMLDQRHGHVIRAVHGGPAQARNIGARAALGNIILFTDADCEPAHDWLACMLAPFRDTQVSGAKGVYRTRQRSLVARFVQQEYQDKYDHMQNQRSIDFVDTYAAAYRRDIFMSSGGFDAAFIVDEDQELSFRLTASGRHLVFVPEAIVHHHHVTSLRRYMRRKFQIGYWKVLVLKRHPDKALGDSHTPQVIKLQLGLLAGALSCTPLAMLTSPLISLALGLWVLLLVSMLPFLGKIAHRDPMVVWVAPVLIVARAFSLGLGLVVGLVRFSRQPFSSLQQS
jgi:glycosyltransferase involved in cell wall biosynthesis